MKRTIDIPRGRLQLLFIIFVLFCLTLVGKLFSLQVVQGRALSDQARREHALTAIVLPRRGTISTADGFVLATTANADHIYAIPKYITDTNKMADELSTLLQLPREDVFKIVSNKDKDIETVSLKRFVDDTVSAQIMARGYAGIFVEHESRRVYPGRDYGQTGFASHLLGFSNVDNNGQYGIEGYYNEYLAGKSGSITAQKDAAGNPLPLGLTDNTPPIDGDSVQLTIDANVQYLAERELAWGLKEYKAKSGSVIVMDPATGAILAEATLPNYNPNDYGITDNKLFIDPVVSSVYEPGSTFKIMTMSAGLDTNAVTPDTTFDDTGIVVVDGHAIRNWNVGVQTPNETMTHVIEQSANVGAVWVARKVGAPNFYRYVKNFGFGVPTRIDLAGEVDRFVKWPGQKGSDWKQIDFAANSFGQGISVTPMQVMAAQGAIANQGNLMRPYIVAKVLAPDGHTVLENKPTLVRQVMTPEHAKDMTEMMVSAVLHGEVRYAGIPGYRVAGKTGTAQVPTANGTYSDTFFIGSTVAFAPVDNPRFIVMVKYDGPTPQWGANTAAPVVGKILQDLLVYYKIPPTEPITSKK